MDMQVLVRNAITFQSVSVCHFDFTSCSSETFHFTHTHKKKSWKMFMALMENVKKLERFSGRIWIFVPMC